MQFAIAPCLSRCIQLALLMIAVGWPTDALADLYLLPSSSVSVSDMQLLDRLVVERNIDQARKTIDEIHAKQKDLPHREVLLAQLMIRHGAVVEGRQVLEAIAVESPNRLDVRLLFTELAVLESRWFEAWQHSLAAEQFTAPEEWSEGYRALVLQQLSILKGLSCEGRRDWAGAVAAYKTIPATAGSTTGFQGLGRAYFHLGKIDLALECFRQVRLLDSTVDLPQVVIAGLFASQENEVEAEQWFRLGMTVDEPTDAELAKFKFAQWLIQSNRPKEIANLLASGGSTEALERERQFLAALVARMEGRAADAQRILSLLHQSDLGNAVISNHLALALIENPDEAARLRALQLAQLNVRNHPTSAEAWSTLGWIQLRLGDLSTAEQSLSQGMQSGHLSRDTAFYLSRLYDAQGRSGQAASIAAVIDQAKGPYFYAWSARD